MTEIEISVGRCGLAGERIGFEEELRWDSW